MAIYNFYKYILIEKQNQIWFNLIYKYPKYEKVIELINFKKTTE